MPKTAKGAKIMRTMKREYGEFIRGLVAADVGAERSRQ